MIVNDFPTNAEYFRAICGFPNYEISTDGRVRIIKTGKIMKLKVMEIGYIQVGLYKDKKQSYNQVHRLVAAAFCNKEDNCNVVDHIDHDRANNNYQNLRWTTNSGNNRNKSIARNNTSGTPGVIYDKKNGWVACWQNQDMNTQHKCFSVNKYGEEQAKQLAIDYRKKMAIANGYLNE